MRQNKRRGNSHTRKRDRQYRRMPNKIRNHRRYAQRQAHDQREPPMNPQSGLQVAANVVTKKRARKNRQRLEQEGLVEKTCQDEKTKRERVRAVVSRGQPTSQQNSQQKIRSGNKPVIDNRESTLGEPLAKSSKEKALAEQGVVLLCGRFSGGQFLYRSFGRRPLRHSLRA